ncbi:MAG: hypothetical protein MUF64_11455 [Polyangiaceae bacterium]|nr:hypothetical protein [Polyangiaceae bacterium]
MIDQLCAAHAGHLLAAGVGHRHAADHHEKFRILDGPTIDQTAFTAGGDLVLDELLAPAREDGAPLAAGGDRVCVVLAAAGGSEGQEGREQQRRDELLEHDRVLQGL